MIGSEYLMYALPHRIASQASVVLSISMIVCIQLIKAMCWEIAGLGRSDLVRLNAGAERRASSSLGGISLYRVAELERAVSEMALKRVHEKKNASTFRGAEAWLER
jgi:hypothetical protein